MLPYYEASNPHFGSFVLDHGSSGFELRRFAYRSVGVFAVSCLCGLAGACAQDLSQPDCLLVVVLHDTADRPVSNVAIEIRSAAPPLERIRAFTKSDGSLTFGALCGAEYNVAVASAILSPPRSVRLGNTAPLTLTLRLPIRLPVVLGREADQVSVQQLGLPPKLQTTMQKAYEAWFQMDLRRSRALALAALQLRAHYPPALTLLGMIDLNDGKPDEAISNLLQALRQDPGSDRAYLTLASAYNQQHNSIAALDALTLMSKVAPENWQLHYETGRAYLGQARFRDAMQEFEHAQQLSAADNLVVRLGKAHALLGLQDYDFARQELAAILEKSPQGIYSAESRRLVGLIDAHRVPAKHPPDTPSSAAVVGMEH